MPGTTYIGEAPIGVLPLVEEPLEPGEPGGVGEVGLDVEPRRTVLDTTVVYLRHIKQGDGTQDGSVEMCGKWFYPAGEIRERFSEQNVRRLNDFGELELTVPNGPSGYCGLFRDEFEVVSRGKPVVRSGGALYYEGGDYRVGDEWLELWREGATVPDAVVSPRGATLTDQQITLVCVDGLWSLNHTTAWEAVFWNHAPRDAFEHNTRVEQLVLGESFEADFPDLIFDDAPQTTDDGNWSYLRASNDRALGRVKLSTLGGEQAYLKGLVFADVGPASADPYGAWRADFSVWVEGDGRQSWPAEQANLYIGLYDATTRKVYARFNTALRQFSANGAFGVAPYQSTGIVDASIPPAQREPTEPAEHRYELAFEAYDQWVHGFIDGQYFGYVPVPNGVSELTLVVEIDNDATDIPGNELYVNVEKAMLRQLVPYLMRDEGDLGDYHLPGVPPPGGLQATYFDDLIDGTDPVYATGDRQWLLPGPIGSREVAQENVLPVIDVQATSDPDRYWPPPPVADPQYFSAIIRGAIELDLANYDYRLRITYDNRIRLWVGKTRYGEQLFEQWPVHSDAGVSPQTSGYLQAHLGEVSGWYPILIHYGQSGTLAAAEITLEWERSDAPDVWTVVPTEKLCPYGTYEADVAHDSHYEQLKSSVADSGHQFIVAPRSLESGLFPGTVAPRIRVGRDTDKVLDVDSALDYATTVDASEAVDLLVADAGGIQFNPDEQAYTVSAFDMAKLSEHFMVHSAYLGDTADITHVPLLVQRLWTYLGLRHSPWEEISAQPKGGSELRDSFPLTGDLAVFAWDPGDAIRLAFGPISVEDGEPRQIMHLTQAGSAKGLDVPVVGFRQRPRGVIPLIRDMFRGLLNDRRRRLPGLRTN